MNNRRLTTDLIAEPGLWRLTLRLSATELHALLLGPESCEHPLLYHAETLTDETLQAVENAVYDNPLLLSDFASVNVILDFNTYTFVPKAVPEVLVENIAQAMLPESAGGRLLTTPLPGDMIQAGLYSADLMGFIARTFPDARLTQAVGVLAGWLDYFNRQRGQSSHLYALYRGEELMVVRFGGLGAPEFINCFKAGSAADAAYYLLGAAGSPDTPISVGGSPEQRNALMETVRTASPGTQLLPLTLPERILEMRRDAPTAPDDMLMSTQL